MGEAVEKGRCAQVGCKKNRVAFGCATHGMRLCMGGGDSCFNKHLRGVGQLKKRMCDVDWQGDECDSN